MRIFDVWADRGREEHHVQESVVSNSSSATDGEIHMVAIVVTREAIEFWVDGENKFVAPLARPVTDCTGLALEIGGTYAAVGARSAAGVLVGWC